MDSPVLEVLSEFVPGVTGGELPRGDRMLRWAEAGSGGPVVIMDSALGEPGTLAWGPSVMPAVARHFRVIAYDRAGLGLSDPADPLTLESAVGDLTALARHAGPDGCILTGHSWSALLAQLVARQMPELVAGLVLVDAAEETYWESLPAEIRQQNYDVGAELLDRHSRGDHAEMIRDAFGRYATLLTSDPEQQARILDAYVACYSKRSQVLAYPGECRLLDASIPEIRRIRGAGPLPDVPLVVLSATEGAREDHRKAWTKLHAELAASVPRGRHVILADTDHAVNQVRPEAVAAAIESVSSAVRSGGAASSAL